MQRVTNDQAYKKSKPTRDEVDKVDSRERGAQHVATNPLQSFPAPTSSVPMLTPYMTWRVSIAAPNILATVTRLENDNALKPESPWPDVQPPASLAPNPIT